MLRLGFWMLRLLAAFPRSCHELSLTAGGHCAHADAELSLKLFEVVTVEDFSGVVRISAANF